MFIKQAIEVLFHGLPAPDVVEKHWLVADDSNVPLYEAKEETDKMTLSGGFLHYIVKNHYFTDPDKAMSLFGNCRIIKNAVKLSEGRFGMFDTTKVIKLYSVEAVE